MLVNREKIIEKKKKKKKANPLEVKSNVRGIFGILFHELSFLPILERELFDRPKEKAFGFHNLFSFLPTQSNTLQKNFLSYFLSKVFHPSYFTFKQTHS